jgi:hypothetical protein
MSLSLLFTVYEPFPITIPSHTSALEVESFYNSMFMAAVTIKRRSSYFEKNNQIGLNSCLFIFAALSPNPCFEKTHGILCVPQMQEAL